MARSPRFTWFHNPFILGVSERLEVLTLAHLIAFDDVGGLHLVAALCVDLLIFDSMAGVLVDLMEADLFTLARSREKRDRA